MKAYKKIMGGIAELEKIVTSLVLTFVTLITFANVVVRKLSDSQFAWTEELVINLFVLLIMLGCGLCTREGSLISLSLIFDRLKVGGKKVLVVITTIVNTVFWCGPAGRRSSLRSPPASTPTLWAGPSGCSPFSCRSAQFS